MVKYKINYSFNKKGGSNLDFDDDILQPPPMPLRKTV